MHFSSVNMTKTQHLPRVASWLESTAFGRPEHHLLPKLQQPTQTPPRSFPPAERTALRPRPPALPPPPSSTLHMPEGPFRSACRPGLPPSSGRYPSSLAVWHSRAVTSVTSVGSEGAGRPTAHGALMRPASECGPNLPVERPHESLLQCRLHPSGWSFCHDPTAWCDFRASPRVTALIYLHS